MATTTQTPQSEAGETVARAPSATFAPAPKAERRPILMIAGIAVVALGGLVSVWTYLGASDAQEVVAVRSTVERGDVIDAADLMTVRVTVDPALHPLPASQMDDVVGQRAAFDLVAGGVVTAEQLTTTAIPAAGQSVVGLNLASTMLPAGQVRVGDAIRVVLTLDHVGGVNEVESQAPDTVDAEVVGIASDPASGNTILNVQVAEADAPVLADRAAAGKVAVVLDAADEG